MTLKEGEVQALEVWRTLWNGYLEKVTVVILESPPKNDGK